MMIVRNILALACMFWLASSVTSAWCDPQREKVLVGELDSSDTSDRAVVKAMLQQRLKFMPSEMKIDTKTWPHFGRLRAETADGLGTSDEAVRMTLSSRNDVLAIISGYAVDGTFSTTISLGEATPSFKVELGFADIPRKASFRKSRDSAALLLYYALLKDAEANNMSQTEVIQPLLETALEIAADVSKEDQEQWVQDITQDLQSLRAKP